jgi:hypothetical protein
MCDSESYETEPLKRLSYETNCAFYDTNRQIKGRIQRKTWCTGPYAGVDYNLTLCRLQSRLKHMYHGQPYAKVDFIPQSGT